MPDNPRISIDGRLRFRVAWLAALLLFCGFDEPSVAAEVDAARLAQVYGRQHGSVQAQSDGLIIAEAEEFRLQRPGWNAINWGDNYSAATIGTSFLSRKSCLAAAEQADQATATITVEIPKAGRYMALVRYEAAFHFETQFRLSIEQKGLIKLDRVYGKRSNPKIMAFGTRHPVPEMKRGWGSTENIFWEGHDACVQLEPGPVTLMLVADKQPSPAAKRNVDLVMLTQDEAEIQRRIREENHAPLDGLLTQAGDVYLKFHNELDSTRTKLAIPIGVEHSPYWVHLRTWQPKSVELKAGESSNWIEVGSLLDSLNDGQWRLSTGREEKLHYRVEIGVKNASDEIDSIATLESREPVLELAYDANTRYSRRIRHYREPLADLVAYLRERPVIGPMPKQTLVYATTFPPHPHDEIYSALRKEFIDMMGIKEPDLSPFGNRDVPAGYIDVRWDKVDHHIERWKREGLVDKIAVVSLGDEIGLAEPSADCHAEFRKWLENQRVSPADVDPRAGGDWQKIRFDVSHDSVSRSPSLYYYSRRYVNHFGIMAQKKLTDDLRGSFPTAGIGANYSPYRGHYFLGDTNMFVTMFRREGMTMPWSEDYIWHVPVGSAQMNFLNLDLFRAAVRTQPRWKIHFYVMAHSPGTTPNAWRRQFYGDLGHGMQIVNLFQLAPVQAAATENYVNAPPMYASIRRALAELTRWEDIVQSGRVQCASSALWFSEAGDIWDDNRDPFAAAKRSLYVAIRHQELPLDVIVEEDALAGELSKYAVLYLADGHVTRAASEKIAAWVAAGGQLFATAGAGMLNELNEPNEILKQVLGVEQMALDMPTEATVRFEKEDLPFTKPLDAATWKDERGVHSIAAYAAKSCFKTVRSEVIGTFTDGSPAISRNRVGCGTAIYCGLLPGLAYFAPAVPKRPVDRGARDDSMAHFIPTLFDPGASTLIGSVAASLHRPVKCSQPLVETSIIRANCGTAIPLVNWTAGPIAGLRVTIDLPVANESVSLASGAPVAVTRNGGTLCCTFDLETADALILR